MIKEVKYIFEHNSYLKNLVPLCRKLGLVDLLHSIQNLCDRNKKEKEWRFIRFFEDHRREFWQLYHMLEDDFSRETLKAVLLYRMDHRLSRLRNVIVQPQYFQTDILKPCMDEVFVDGGAYVGDTVEAFLKYTGGGVPENICLGA